MCVCVCVCVCVCECACVGTACQAAAQTEELKVDTVGDTHLQFHSLDRTVQRPSERRLRNHLAQGWSGLRLQANLWTDVWSDKQVGKT